jgi:hypothetical protein
MQMPDVSHTIRDAERDVTYIVLAYRKLSRAELVQAVRVFSAARKRAPKRGSTIRIVTTFGSEDG